MANPNNAVGTNGAFGGRTSVNAFNDVANFWTRGRVSGWECSPKSGLTVQLGGVSGFRDVALAQDPSGNKTTVNNISGVPVEITLNAAPASNSRVDAIVAYIEDSPNGSGETDNPDVVNLLVVSGTVASMPAQPTDSAIRVAITADGASGSTAYYVVLACVTISAGTTDIDATMIAQGEWSQLSSNHILDNAVTADKVDFTTIPPIAKGLSATHLTTSSTARTKVGEIQITGLSPTWEYLVLINYGLLHGTSQDCVVLSDITEPITDTTLTLAVGRMRGGLYQSSPSWSTVFTPPSSSITLNVNAHIDRAGTCDIEQVQVIFVPLRPAS